MKKSTELGPTGSSRCPYCSNSLDNCSPADRPHLRFCANCKTDFIPLLENPFFLKSALISMLRRNIELDELNYNYNNKLSDQPGYYFVAILNILGRYDEVIMYCDGRRMESDPLWYYFETILTENQMTETYEGKQRYLIGSLIDPLPLKNNLKKCLCPETICPVHGRLDKSELKHGRQVRIID